MLGLMTKMDPRGERSHQSSVLLCLAVRRKLAERMWKMARKDVSMKISLNDPEVNRSGAPPQAPVRDHAEHMEYGKQVAKQDAASKSIDIAFIMALGESPLPEERAALSRFGADRALTTNSLENAKSIENALSVLGGVGLSVEGSRLGPGYQSTINEEQKKVEEYDEVIPLAQQQRGLLADILAGKGVYSDNIQWAGDPVPPPGPDTTRKQIRFSRASLQMIALRLVPYLILFPVELVIVVATVKAHSRNNDWLFPAAIGFAILVGLVYLPGRIGIAGAIGYRRGYLMPKEILRLAVLLLFWLGSVAITVAFRVEYEFDQAMKKAAELHKTKPGDLDALAVFYSGGLSEIYSYWFGVFLWLIPVAAIGAAVIVAKLFGHNPVTEAVLREDLNIVNLYDWRFVHATILERGKALVEASKDAARISVGEWEHYRDVVIPAQVREYCAHYRRWLAHYLGDPAMTQALFDHPLSDHGDESWDSTDGV